MSGKYQAPSVKKAFQILKLISDTDGGVGISDLAKSLGMGKSTVHGITAALEELGTIIRDPVSKRYTLGFTLLELGRSAHSQIDLKDVARPVMEDLMEETQESVFIGVLNGERVTILDMVESRQDLKMTSTRGTTIPLLAGAVGKVFLSTMDDDKAKEIILKKGLPSFTEHSVSDPQQYLQAIKVAREKGYATDYEEYILGVRAVASPIKGENHLISAIWVVGFKTSLNDHKMETVIDATKRSAEEISHRIREQVGGPLISKRT
ncbi:MAG: IclR family transcriptional regulator [Desulfobacteraceae bacterium]|nr:IclR family transcriptional regulator [Desulfobacteraceae bacterium]